MKLRDYAQFAAVYLIHLVTKVFKVKVVYHVRRLGTDYKRTETRGVSVTFFENPIDALLYIRQAVPNVKQDSLYFILAETRFAFTPVVAEIGGEEATIGDHGSFYEATPGIGLGVHPAAPAPAESGRVLADRGEGEELPDAGASRVD